MNDLATNITEFPLEEFAPDLTPSEQMLLYQLEVIGLPVSRAAEIAGVKSPYHVLKRPQVVAGREYYRRAVQGRTDFSRNDIIAGMKHAIDMAGILGEPMSQIAGWREIAKLKGFDKTPNVNINLNGSVEQVAKQLRSMPTEQLVELSGNQVLDTDFYRVTPDDATD